MAVPSIRTVLIEDERLAREELKRQLEPLPQIELVGEAATFEQAQALLCQARPRLAFMEVQIDGGSGLELLADAPGTETAEALGVATSGTVFRAYSPFGDRQSAQRSPGGPLVQPALQNIRGRLAEALDHEPPLRRGTAYPLRVTTRIRADRAVPARASRSRAGTPKDFSGDVAG